MEAQFQMKETFIDLYLLANTYLVLSNKLQFLSRIDYCKNARIKYARSLILLFCTIVVNSTLTTVKCSLLGIAEKFISNEQMLETGAIKLPILL